MMIKNRTKFVLTVGIGLSLFSGLSQAMFLKKGANDRTLLIPNPSAPARLGALALIHDDQQKFSVLRESGEINEIPNHLVAKDLREIPQDEVKARLDNNINFRVQQGSDDEFSLQEVGGLNGGGGDDSWVKSTANTISNVCNHPVAGPLIGLVVKVTAEKAFNSLRAETAQEKDTEKIYESKLKLNECMLKHIIPGITTKTPSACEKLASQYQVVASAEQLAAALQCLKPLPQ